VTPPRAEVFIATAQDKMSALRDALAGAHLLGDLERRRAASGKPAQEFRVVIKSDPGVRSLAPPTDLELVEDVERSLRGAGYSSVTVLSGEAGPVVSHDFGSVLGRHPVLASWHAADYRISFAACRTDPRCFYATTVANVLGCIGSESRAGRATFYERAVLVADRLPIHFALLDAWVSHDGVGNRPTATHSIIASTHPLAVDWVAGEKMSLDPALNFVVQEELHRWGRIALVRRGNQTPWNGWRNVRGLFVFLRTWFNQLSEREGAGWVARALQPAVTRRAQVRSRRRPALA
jgi:uncharacterized protein DUF362